MLIETNSLLRQILPTAQDIARVMPPVLETTVEANLSWFKEYNKGYKCARCGYDACDAAIEFHHLDPSQKEGKHDAFARWKHKTPHWFRNKIKTTKYVLLCANCHRELHAGKFNILLRYGFVLDGKIDTERDLIIE
jgi:hypothetical protein